MGKFSTWNLRNLLHDPVRDFDVLRKEVEDQIQRFEGFRGRLSAEMPAETFLEALRLAETIARAASKLGAYAYLWFSENTKEQRARSFKATVEELQAGLANRMLFFDLWWQKLDDANAGRLLAASGDYAYHLETIRRFKDHTLSEPEEKIINVKSVTGRQAVMGLYDILTSGLTYHMRVKGRRVRMLTREDLMVYARDSDTRVRETAYCELYRVFAQNADVLGDIYKTLVLDWKQENLGLRKHRSPIAVRNLLNDIPEQAVEALLSVCARNAGIFQDYFRLKARLCRIKKMSRFHIYAPFRETRKQYAFKTASAMVLEAYRGFSPRLADLAQRVLQERHVDRTIRPGKTSGAYCYSVIPGLTPYVLLNFKGDVRDIATLAHELGHAVHGMLAADHSVFTFHATLPLAETASVFGERILSDALMAGERNKAVKQSLLIRQLDDVYATILRQAYFVRFEREAHRIIGEGGTMDDLCRVYLAELRQQFGRAVAVPDEFRWEWLSIPHLFASPFYCYAYSFGNLLVLALYGLYKTQGESFVPRYLDLLAAGGSRAPESLLKDFGVDIRAEAFWQAGFETIKGMVRELEAVA
ncbi:MAG TPA: M3 family oligoendopeptidase [Nitrospirales bacterium]